LLHQQYMQLYGLPTSFLQSTVNNGGGAGFPGAYGGGYGGFPGYYGVNYQRNLAALQAYQAYYAASAMQNAYYGRYGPAPAITSAAPSSSASNSYGSFGISGTSLQPTFAQLTNRSNDAPRFVGFGLTNTANPFLSGDVKRDEKKEEQKADK
jgi:hypothetical protein